MGRDFDGVRIVRVDVKHWSIWASDCRETGSGNIGYPSATTFYTPSRRRESGDAPIAYYKTEEDERVADLIGRAVSQANNSDRHALIEWYGARPGAPREREERMKILRRDLNRGPTQVRAYVETARSRIEGWVEGHLEALASSDKNR